MLPGTDPIWAELINSDWRDHRGSGAREDRLENAEWLAAFLRLVGWRRAVPPTRKERDELRRLRDLLTRMVDAVLAGEGVTDADRDRLNRVLAGAPAVRRLDEAAGALHLAEVPVAPAAAAAAGAVAAAFAVMLAEGDPSRLRRCANPDCGWVIYDRSRNRSRKWCETGVCGSLIAVRRFRLRRRGTPAGDRLRRPSLRSAPP